MLRGKKTYLLLGLGILTKAAQWVGIIDDHQSTQVLETLGIGTVATLKMALARVENDVKAPVVVTTETRP